jgi:hypothetical protein
VPRAVIRQSRDGTLCMCCPAQCRLPTNDIS